MSNTQNTTSPLVPSTSSSTFPSCAVHCTLLLEAQSTCISKTNSSGLNFDFINLETCFCQSAFLAPLYSTPDATCATECLLESERKLLQTWYTQFCEQVSRGITTGGQTSGSSGQAKPTQNAGATSTGVTSSGLSTAAKAGIAVGCVIVVLGLLAAAYFAVRRHRRKARQTPSSSGGVHPSIGQGAPVSEVNDALVNNRAELPGTDVLKRGPVVERNELITNANRHEIGVREPATQEQTSSSRRDPAELG